MAREVLKGIKSENRLSKVRLIMPNDPVIGGQPSDNADEFTSNTPFLDLACSIQYAITQAANANTAAKNADTKAANAQTSANQAKTAAATADGKAVAAQKTADEAKTAAAAADSKAVAAQTSANTANTAAKNADTKAANAQTSANQAKTAADNAQKKANQVPNPVADQFVVGNTTTAYKLMTVAQVKILLGVPAAQKLYSGTGQATDGSMTQKAVTDAINAVKTTANKVARGWRKDPNTGLIEQWGTESISNSRTTIKFPIAFTKLSFFIMTNHFKNDGYGASDTINISSRNNIQFVAQIRTAMGSDLAGQFDWYAIGE